jgi:hypothetical protein
VKIKDPMSVFAETFNVFYRSSGKISHLAAPPKRVLLSVQLLHNHKIKFYEILDSESLDSSTLSPVVTLYMALAARWWCSCTCQRGLSLVTLYNTHFRLCNQRTTFLSLQHSSTGYILLSLLTFMSLAVVSSPQL